MPTNPVKKNYTFSIKEFYWEYKQKKKAEGIKVKNIIPYKQYRAIIESFFFKVSEKIIRDNFVFMMPYSLGSVHVKSFGKKIRRAKVDPYESKKHKKRIRYVNQHSNHHTFGFYWNKYYVNFKNKSYYGFKAVNSDKSKRLGIGKKGLCEVIWEHANDPHKRSYLKI